MSTELARPVLGCTSRHQSARWRPSLVPPGLEQLFADAVTVLLPARAAVAPAEHGMDLVCVVSGGLVAADGCRSLVTGDVVLVRPRHPGAPPLRAACAARLLRVEGDRLQARFTERPATAARLLAIVDAQATAELRWTSATLRLDTHGRVAALLLRRAALSDGGWLEMPQSDLAALVGASRQTVNRVLSGLQERQVVERDGRAIRVVDAEALNRLVGVGLGASAGPVAAGQ